ncbi:hypothetical protein MKW98_019557 [Papaver atlanticum]|uniref:Uncharacterized protein n=1 Tax=Papaver atlanticum TaxID=357466 RepID=A0AAD4XA74_9MAGN|nr:hypothetical protein MKW98_019557 [Papaver atlanticum]
MSYGFTWKEKVVTTRMLFLLVQPVLLSFAVECQRHGKYLTRYRAIFIANCKIKINQVLRPSYRKPKTSNNKWKRWWWN